MEQTFDASAGVNKTSSWMAMAGVSGRPASPDVLFNGVAAVRGASVRMFDAVAGVVGTSPDVTLFDAQAGIAAVIDTLFLCTARVRVINHITFDGVADVN